MKRLHNSIYLIALLFFIIAFSSCSEDDTIGNRAPENSFLAINEKSIYESRDGIFFRFLNNTTNPFEQFEVIYEPVSCMFNYRNFVEAPFWYENLELLENSENTLKIRYIDLQGPSNSSVMTLEFTVLVTGGINLRWNDSDADEDNWILAQTGHAYTDYEHDCN